VPDKRKHRGPHPADEELFSEGCLEILREAVADLSWLLTRGYSDTAALKLVGDRFGLRERQRKAVLQCSCSDQSLEHRRRVQVKADGATGETLHLDGFNVLTTLEAALAGGVITVGRDRCYRDLASMHGSYRKVQETETALRFIGETLAELGAGATHWYLDSPVSNSGRLAQLIRGTAEAEGWNWDAELVSDPDPILSESKSIVCTADSVILDSCSRWLNLAREVIDRHIPAAWKARLG